jgi:hypothetical protein
MKKKKQTTMPSKVDTFKPQGQFSPTSQNATLKRYYLPILKQQSPAPDKVPPVLLLGVKGGVGVSTFSELIGDMNKIIDLASFDTRRQWVSYLPRVILVSNYTYSSVESLQGVMQQFTDKKQFRAAGFTPIILGAIINDNTNVGVTPAVKRLLEYVTSGVQTWEFKFVPSLTDVADPREAGIPSAFWKKIESIVAQAAQ